MAKIKAPSKTAKRGAKKAAGRAKTKTATGRAKTKTATGGAKPAKSGTKTARGIAKGRPKTAKGGARAAKGRVIAKGRAKTAKGGAKTAKGGAKTAKGAAKTAKGRAKVAKGRAIAKGGVRAPKAGAKAAKGRAIAKGRTIAKGEAKTVKGGARAAQRGSIAKGGAKTARGGPGTAKGAAAPRRPSPRATAVAAAPPAAPPGVPPDTVQRLRQAYAKLPPDKQRQVKQLMLAAHLHTARAKRGLPPVPPATAAAALAGAEASAVPGELAHAFSALFPEEAAQLETEPESEAELAAVALPPHVAPDGTIYGTGKYQQLDAGWLLATAIWLENAFYKYPFQTNPATVQINQPTVRIALVADWGTGNFDPKPSPAVQIGQALQRNPPDVAIHLGDTYYAGTPDEVRNNMLAYWTRGKSGSFALNSNHEMYPGGTGYFKTLLANPAFVKQQGTSYFALETPGFIVAGLDSAYSADVWRAYMVGALDSQHQIPFLSGLAARAKQQNKKVIVLTHHNGLTYDGARSSQPLWSQVLKAFPPASAPERWYWGHVHLGAVYSTRQVVASRCLGHGGIPWGYAKGLQKPTVTWFEQKKNPVNRGLQVMNGYVMLTLQGNQLTEAFFDQTGAQSWP